MTDNTYLTIHTLTALPWHNLNRDDRGLPKQVREGGKARGRLSSQALKRAARVAFELASHADGGSARSRELATEVIRRAESLAVAQSVDFDADAAMKAATKVIKSLAANAKESAEPTDDGVDKAAADTTMTWLSGGEMDELAAELVRGSGKISAADVVKSTTGSLAIAAFGRMFAAQPDLQTEAAVAVGPATTTHPITIEVDYFTTVDDLAEGGGAGHLGQAFYTTGVYYRSVTIDKTQLRKTWTALNQPDASERLALLVRSLILALPTGKDTSTAAHTQPALILVEEQAHRVAYEFHEPVKAGVDGGYLTGSIQRLFDQASAARAFDVDEFGATWLSGTSITANPAEVGFAHKAASLPELITAITEWIMK